MTVPCTGKGPAQAAGDSCSEQHCWERLHLPVDMLCLAPRTGHLQGACAPWALPGLGESLAMSCCKPALIWLQLHLRLAPLSAWGPALLDHCVSGSHSNALQTSGSRPLGQRLMLRVPVRAWDAEVAVSQAALLYFRS